MILGIILTIVGFGDTMLLIFPMWIFAYLFKEKISLLLNRFPLPVAFIGTGIFFGLLTEFFAILNNLSVPAEQRILISPNPALDLIYGFFYYMNLIVVWYLLLRKISYSKKEVFLITGLVGIFTEESGQVFLRILSTPLEGSLYTVIVMFVYGIFPMITYLLCEERFKRTKTNFALKYIFAILALFLQWAIYGLFLLPLLKLVFG